MRTGLKHWHDEFLKLDFVGKHNVIQAVASALSMLISATAIAIAVWSFRATFPMQQKERELQQQSLELEQRRQEIADLRALIEKNNNVEASILKATEAYGLGNIAYPIISCRESDANGARGKHGQR